ncbi:MAG: RNA polymerase sigma-70 factor [Tannerella sp.]|jgi:RNA polymerase sigma-70 factor (ECF subfamily)|nr:RNA polymerase sigma-70 factor [Tannerella sp.]
MISEAEIILGIKEGREDAYNYIYKHLYKLLCTIARELVHDQAVAEMMVSDVIFSLWQNRQSLTVRTSLRNYLIKAVRNRCMNFLAQSERQISLHQQYEIHCETEYTQDGDQQDNPLTLLIEKELDMKINAVIEALPPQTRRIFCLSRFKKLKYEEIAGQTGSSIDTVKYHIKSALARLRTELKDYMLPLLVFFLSI